MLSMPGSAAGAARTHTVVIEKMKFGPMPAHARQGDIIVWDNRDMFRHTATAKAAFDIDLPAGAARKMRLSRTGNFQVICKFHPGMKGVLKVAK
jgi:plastocyanin